MTNAEDIHSRERLGWAFLLGGFAVFLAVAISIPIAVGAYVQESTQPLPTSVQANQGTVRIDDLAGLIRATSAGDPPETVESGAEILTDATATALVFVHPPDSEQVLARMEVYGNTAVRLDLLEAPRFDISNSEQRLVLTMQSGRLRLTVPENAGRPFTILINVPTADPAQPASESTVDIQAPGQYSVEVTNALTQVAVQSGRALVRTASEELALIEDQRAVIPTEGGLAGPLDTERNLVVNGDFRDGFEQWTRLAWNVELPNQPEGNMEVTTIGGESMLRISRSGEGHADVRLRQAINQDVADYEDLRLLLTFRILEQDLDVCGFQGSECPLFLRLNYLDASGVSHSWQHGFYSAGQVSASTSPDACISCDVVQTAHQLVQPGRVYFYEANILAGLARQGFLPPRLIETVGLVSSGHSFAVDVMDVALMAKE